MAMLGSGTPVRTPDVAAPVHNLLDSGNIVETGDKEWENGVSFTQLGCYIVTGDEADYCAELVAGTPQDCFDAPQFAPYVLDVGIVYSTIDKGIDIKDIATQTLEIGTSSRLERLIWAGSSGDTNPLLSDGTSLGAALGPRAALGAVMSALVAAETHTGALGTIHMSPRISTELESLLYEDSAGVLRTVVGKHKVIIGNYPHTHIAAHVGDIDVYLGEPFLAEADDEVARVNELILRVQRTALATWNTCATFTQAVTLS